MPRRVLVPIVALLAASTALAQDGETGWQVVREPDKEIVYAYLGIGSGVTIAFRCDSGVYSALLTGLPEADEDWGMLPVMMSVRGEPADETRWSIARNRTIARADYPAPLARSLRQGGPVTMTIADGAGRGRDLRLEVDLPTSSALVDETLTTCGKPLTDTRDETVVDLGADGLPDNVTWSVPPRPRYPGSEYNRGIAVVSCIVQPDGRVDECQIESEYPADGRFGINALRGMADARIVSPDETSGAYAPRLVGFRVNFRTR